MDKRQHLIQALDKIEGHIAMGLQHIANQESLIKRRQLNGLDSRRASELLATFRESQALHQKHRDAILAEFATLPFLPRFDGVAVNSELGFLLKPVLEELVAATKFQKGTLQILEQTHLAIQCQHGFDAELMRRFARVTETSESSCGRAMRWRKSVWIGDVLADENADYRSLAIRAGFRSVLSQPLISNSGFFGVVSVHDAVSHDDPPADISHVGEFVADVMMRHAGTLTA